jgi:hypothetical protein
MAGRWGQQGMSGRDEQFGPDPVIEAYKRDVDRTLIRENLRLSVEERFEKLARLQEFAEELQSAGREKETPLDLSVLDAGYLAGLVDGEGCITAFHRRAYTEHRERNPSAIGGVRIAMCAPDLIQWICSVTGLGKVYHLPARKKTHKDSWLWQPGLQGSARFLEAILPYLRLKRQQASLLIELAQIKSQSRRGRQNNLQRQQEIVKEIQVLNKRRGVNLCHYMSMNAASVKLTLKSCRR